MRHIVASINLNTINTIMEQTNTIYYINFGGGTIYFKVVDNNTIVCYDKSITMPLQRFIDFINTAKELGLKAGIL